MNSLTPSLLCLAICIFTVAARGQVPPEIAARLIEIGPVINMPATAQLYAGRVKDKEPYASVTVERDIRYGPAERNVLDVFAPAAASTNLRPVVVYVHGGGFVAGNRRIGPDSPFHDNVMLWAAREGMVGVSMTYRLAPDHPWPAGAEDVGLALHWVNDRIATFGGDSKRIFLFGHSAGASHVAAYVAKPGLSSGKTARLAGALLLSGVYQITPELVAQSPALAGYFGTQVERYAERSSIAGLLATPTNLWVGSAELDPMRIKEQAELLRGELRKAGRPFMTATFPAHNHMSQTFSINSDDSSVSDALLAFIRSK